MIIFLMFFLIICVAYYFFSKRYMCDAPGHFLHWWDWEDIAPIEKQAICHWCGKRGSKIKHSDFY